MQKLDPDVRRTRRQILEALGFDTRKLADARLVPTETVIRTLKTLEGLGLSPDEIRRMARCRPRLLHAASEGIRENVFLLTGVGFTLAEIRRIARLNPLALVESPERTWGIIRSLVAYGFSYGDVAKMTASHPSILVCSEERTREALLLLERRGFSRASVCRLAWSYPMIITQAPEKTGRSFAELSARLGSRARARQVVLRLPSVLTNDGRKNGEIIDVFSYVGIDPAARGGIFAFSPKLLRGRIAFFESRGQKKWPGWLFQSNPCLRRKLGVTREQMLALDPGPEAFRTRPAC